MDDEWWLSRGVRPFEGPVDEWPADRADMLQRVIQIREQVVAAKEAEARSQAEHEQRMANRGKR